MDQEHERFRKVADVMAALPGDLELKPCILAHRVDDGCFVVQGNTLDELDTMQIRPCSKILKVLETHFQDSEDLSV